MQHREACIKIALVDPDKKAPERSGRRSRHLAADSEWRSPCILAECLGAHWHIMLVGLASTVLEFGVRGNASKGVTARFHVDVVLKDKLKSQQMPGGLCILPAMQMKREGCCQAEAAVSPAPRL